MGDRTTPRFMLLLSSAARAAQKVSDAGLSDLGVTAAQAGGLFALGLAEDVGVVAVADQMGLSQSAASVLVQRLIAQGLVVKVPDPGDGRAVRLTLTEKGRSVCAEAARRARVLNARIAGSFSEPEQAIIARFLEHVIQLQD